MTPTNLIRAIIWAAVFGAAVLLLGGVLTRLGGKAGTAVRGAV